MEAAVRKLFPFFRRVRVEEDRPSIERVISDPRVVDENGRVRLGDTSQYIVVARSTLEWMVSQDSRREVTLEIANGIEARNEDASSEPPAIAAADSSAGLLLALAHFSLVYADEAGRLIELEEPENGLNARITLDMMREFLRVVQRRRRQLILTTHNAWWLDLVPAESIRVVTRDAEGAHIHQPDPARLQSLREQLDVYPSEIVSAHGPEALLADSLVDEEP